MSGLYERLKTGPVVYFLKNSENAVKIGTSRCMGSRMKNYRDHYCSVPTLLAVEPGGHSRERGLHKQFADLQINNHEWFKLEGKLLLHIAKLWADQTFEHGTVIPLTQFLKDTKHRRKRYYPAAR